ncbi:hypothetical protein COHA_006352, partial [Chlorella ohadii]
AGWLYRATGEDAYLSAARGYLQRAQYQRNYFVSWDSVYSAADALLLGLGVGPSPGVDLEWQAAAFRDTWLKGQNGVSFSPRGLAIAPLGGWGVNRYAANAAFVALLHAKHTSDAAVRSACLSWAQRQLDYMLGLAGSERSFVVGYGSNPPTRPHHRAASCPDRPAPCTYDTAFNAAGPNPQPGRPRRAAAARGRAAMPVSAQIDVLVADIGGTNCRFQVWALDSFFRPSRMVVEKFYATKDYAHFRDALAELLKLPELSGGARPKAAAFACAGPVQNQRCTMTNLGWIIDKAEVEKEFGIRCTVLNDFEAVGYGVPVLTDGDLVVLHDVPAVDKGPKAVLGPGTGLGEAQLFWDDATGNYKVHASEGSHATFAPRGWKQRALQAHVEQERGHCSVERVACGDGLVRIYNFLRSDEPSQYPQDRMDRSKEVTPADITGGALDKSDPVAVEALDMFLSIVGAEAGHMALRSLATGGVYVIERVKAGGMQEAFLWRASRFHDKVLKHIPLYVVTNDKVGLLGTRECAIRIVEQMREELTIAT